MKRHEYLYSALAAFGAAFVFIVFGSVVLHVLNPYLDAAEIGFMFFKMIPIAFIAIGAVFAVIGAYALVNERMIENGEVIEAEITGINEFFVGQTTEIVHYNLFCEAVINGRKYRFSKKNLETNPKEQFAGGYVPVKINPKNPMQYFIMM